MCSMVVHQKGGGGPYHRLPLPCIHPCLPIALYKYRSPLVRYGNGNHWTVGVVCVAGEADGVRGAGDCDQGHKVGDGDDASSRVGPGDN